VGRPGTLEIMKNHDIQVLRNRKGDDSLPSKLGMKPRLHRYSDRKYNSRRISENYNHMVRFLRANCNRPWDKVYSEVKKKNFFGSSINIDDYLFGQVTVKPVFKKGIPYMPNGVRPLYKNCYGSFYVTKHGILAEATLKRPPWNKRKPNPNVVKVDDVTYLLRREKDMVWFIVGYSEPVPYTYRYASGKESIHYSYPGKISAKDLELPHIEGFYASFMKTLSKKEKKKYKLI